MATRLWVKTVSSLSVGMLITLFVIVISCCDPFFRSTSKNNMGAKWYLISFLCTNMYTYIHVSIIYIYIYIYTNKCIHIYIYTYICVYRYIHTEVCIIYIYIYIRRPLQGGGRQRSRDIANLGGSLFRKFGSLWGLTVSLSSLFFPILMHSLGDVWHPGPGVPCFGGFAGFAAFGGSQSHFLPYSSLS